MVCGVLWACGALWACRALWAYGALWACGALVCGEHEVSPVSVGVSYQKFFVLQMILLY